MIIAAKRLIRYTDAETWDVGDAFLGYTNGELF